MKKLWMLLATGFVLTGCAEAVDPGLESAETIGQATSSMEVVSTVDSENAIAVTISVMEDGEVIDEGTKALEVEEGTNLLEAMKDNYAVEAEENFITSINGHEQDDEAGKYWLFDINGEESMVGADQVELKEGDLVEFDLSPYEE